MTEQENRIYAADLLHRAGVPFDPSDVSRAAKVIELVEQDVSKLVAREVRGYKYTCRRLLHGIASGEHRTQAEPAVAGSPGGADAKGKPVSNLKAGV
ncbi:MAG: hypothetical protein ABJP02_05055 [Parasphingorhabdus sp.]|uniref:hypothetical protein n=1 Tax=Parasphingorhabdus sp. TaxID=2709688 RepID=UPI00329A4F06